MKKLLLLFLLCTATLNAQNASPLGGVGNLQFFDNNGVPLVSGVVYIYQAGTSTQVAVYTDATGTTTQPNPVTFGSGARASIWLANSTFVKIVLCIQNDGAFCTAGDILFTADQVPIGSSGGGSSGSPFTGIFISGTASPATSGTLRLASGDFICWRNAAGSANLCFSKDANDLLSWAGGSLKLAEVGAPSGVIAFDILWADNTAHRLKAVNNAGTAAQYVLSGVDVNTLDQVTQLHFGATATPLSGTAPTTGQVLQWNGTNIVGASTEFVWTTWLTGVGTIGNCGNLGVTGVCIHSTFPNAHTITRFNFQVSTGAVGCGTQAVVGIKDVTSSTVLETVTVSQASGTYFDSGVLAIAMTAGDEFQLGLLTSPVGCGTLPVIESVSAILQ